MDRVFDWLGDRLRSVLGGDAGAATGTRRGRPRQVDDPDLAAAWEELDAFLESDGNGGGARQRATGAGDGQRATAARDPREHLRNDYATLGVPFAAPPDDVKRAYKRLMRAHHPDRFANDPARQADATRKAARLNAAYARIEDAARSA